VGLKGFDAMRQLKLGVFNVMAVQLGYVSGDEPFVLGIDLPGVAPDLKTARVVVDSYRELFSSRLEAKYNAYTLALWPFPGQVFFCREKIGGLADLKGKKVRSFTPAMASLIQHFGGIPVTLAFSEVYQSLQRGVADCGITGTLSGNTSKWFEVTTHLYPLSIGWGVQAHLVNKDFLDKMTPGARTALIAQFKKLEAEMWDLAIKTFDDGVNCSVGKDPCQYGVKANMTLVPVNPDDVAKLREATLAAVLPVWAKECNANYPDCTKLWNQTVGKAVSLEIK
jgi:TRAP-type C4-dicarboxylate transport system substrate-binding protein